METRNKSNFMYSGICDWILLTGDDFWRMSFYKTKKKLNKNPASHPAILQLMLYTDLIEITVVELSVCFHFPVHVNAQSS